MSNEFDHIFDIDELGAALGGRRVEVLGPDGRRAERIVWTPELAEALCADIAGTMRRLTPKQVAHRGSAPLWVMGAAMAAMYPARNTFLPPFEGVRLPLSNLSQGEPDPTAEVEFDLKRAGDVLYVTYRADDPNKPQIYGGGHHSYNPDLIPRIKAPAAGPEVHVCLRGNSSYNVTMSIATAYFTGCKSLSILGGGPNGPDAGYFCCVTHSSQRRLGDLTPAR